jgi:gluconate 2-dehydrogenase gamma chain
MEYDSSRRRFLAVLGSGATALWFADNLSTLGDVARHTDHGMAQPAQRRLEFFSAAEARVVDAIASRILPSDDGTPGAHEAGALYFIDRVSARHLPAEMRMQLRDGLATLQKDVASRHANARDFAALTKEQQDAVLRERETSPFFELARTLTLAGVLSSPKFGGNRNYVGWKLVGHDPSPTSQPPFGYYDRPAIRRQLLGDNRSDA